MLGFLRSLFKPKYDGVLIPNTCTMMECEFCHDAPAEGLMMQFPSCGACFPVGQHYRKLPPCTSPTCIYHSPDYKIAALD